MYNGKVYLPEFELSVVNGKKRCKGYSMKMTWVLLIHNCC